MDFIIIGLQPWDIEIGSNCKNIALELSKKHRVLYVNNPLDRKSVLAGSNSPDFVKRKKIMQKTEEGLMKVQDNLWTYYPSCVVESINWVRPHSLFKWINRINNKRFADSISLAIKRLGFKDYVLFNDNSIFLGYYQKEFLKPTSYIYYIRDNLTKVKWWSFHASKLEPQLIKKSDLVVTNSLYYEAYAKSFNVNSKMIGQGCDFTLLKPKSKVSFDYLNGKTIGYVGYLSVLRLSLTLIEKIATTFKDLNVILVGPEDEYFQSSKLHQLNNVQFLGAKKPEELGSYIQAFDICFNPQVVNEITIGNYPRKIDEYLYFGKTVIATHTDAMKYFQNHVYLAKNDQDFLDLVRNILAENDLGFMESRKTFALEHTWENSVKKLLEYI
jgi:glycosyltransferase involved in cell wall biosynthesis